MCGADHQNECADDKRANDPHGGSPPVLNSALAKSAVNGVGNLASVGRVFSFDDEPRL